MTENKLMTVDVRDVVLFQKTIERVSGEIFSEGKGSRPSVVFCIRNNLRIALPLYSSVKEGWKAPCGRLGIEPRQGNGLEKLSQIGVDNSFILKEENFVKKIGQVDEIDFISCLIMFEYYRKSLKDEELFEKLSIIPVYKF
ncbi:hypothetical protein [Acetobacter okinawensis]|uniref:hypothetical protein n=1 Tax=Acetobacter okinawensis TaxID=1076594 RepID=UPI0020A014CD|nr:hypothetical protein [Acetobacter okinawensis]MCP1214382.1 hypothetical protein [Acetobacter okinawensis]